MICPRCDSDQVKIVTKSPVGDVWEVYICESCWFSWRSTEKVEVQEDFRLNEEKLRDMQVIPPVPPLKKA
jgi:protein-arginine kinase activator protein McsA